MRRVFPQVRIEGETAAYAYWYVLTYLPDLQWCHVAPLEKRGVFGSSSSSAGRPRWMLVPEDAGGEIDVSAARYASPPPPFVLPRSLCAHMSIC